MFLPIIVRQAQPDLPIAPAAALGAGPGIDERLWYPHAGVYPFPSKITNRLAGPMRVDPPELRAFAAQLALEQAQMQRAHFNPPPPEGPI